MDNEEKEINLCEILKGHEGEFFYSPLYGKVKLVKTDAEHMLIKVKSVLGGYYHSFTASGKYLEDDWGGECVLFPSKTQRDWNKWIEENKPKPKIPKTWSDTLFNSSFTVHEFRYIDSYKDYVLTYTGISPIERSTLALLRIRQLIEVGYGGNVTNDEWEKAYIISCTADKIFTIHATNCIHTIAFHTKEQAEEFLKYPENVQLLKDYFMI